MMVVVTVNHAGNVDDARAVPSSSVGATTTTDAPSVWRILVGVFADETKQAATRSEFCKLHSVPKQCVEGCAAWSIHCKKVIECEKWLIECRFIHLAAGAWLKKLSPVPFHDMLLSLRRILDRHINDMAVVPTSSDT